ncbi:4Fe4S-binding leucine-rich repeat protein [Methylocapsa aurea]|uniref:4Fe4S-binding leucine-rich repeat protein n=1 Tax=Methylocapsa aurea TaxID=663610 RepID=UPI00055E6959|nr:4Fe4S-binding leucine-rich repeat protein [Methylocapsa aurea]
MKSEIDEARDFAGKEIDCAACKYQNLQKQGKCQLKQACVKDRYARRIDRFFDWNPSLANDHLADPYFEARAVAAKHADIFRLPAMLADSDETVRWAAAARLPDSYLLRLRDDPHREVRIRVASRLDDAGLVSMMNDRDYYVRTMIARRLSPSTLPMMINDPEPEVRRTIVRRIDAAWLMRMAQDKDPGVRLEVARRLSDEQLGGLQQDPDWRVRYEVASRIAVSRLADMQDDADPLVRDVARQRGGNVKALDGSAPIVKMIS